MDIVDIVYLFVGIWVALCLFACLRAEVVYRASIQAIDAIDKKYRWQRANNIHDISDPWEPYNSKSFASMMLNLRAWKFADFYPELADENRVST